MLYNPAMDINQTSILNSLLNNIRNCSGEVVTLENFYYPALRLTSEVHPRVIQGDNESMSKVNVELKFICSKDKNGHIDYSSSYFTLAKNDPRDSEPGLTFHTFSDMVSRTTANSDVLTFYVTFILVIGNVVRNMLSGEENKIILTEMPEPIALINLCEGIKISRYAFEFEREEYLYYVLIDYMRSPEILKIMTKSSIKTLVARKEEQIRMSMLN
jgi:hypothetical protein